MWLYSKSSVLGLAEVISPIKGRFLFCKVDFYFYSYFFASRTKYRWFDQTCVVNVAFDLEYIFCFTLFFETRISYLLQYLKILLTLVDLIGSFKQIDFANTLLLMHLHKSILWFFSVLVLL